MRKHDAKPRNGERERSGENTNESQKASAEINRKWAAQVRKHRSWTCPKAGSSNPCFPADAPDVVHSGRDKENPPGDTLRYRTAKREGCSPILIKCKRINIKTSRIPPRSQPENPIIMAKAWWNNQEIFTGWRPNRFWSITAERRLKYPKTRRGRRKGRKKGKKRKKGEEKWGRGGKICTGRRKIRGKSKREE